MRYWLIAVVLFVIVIDAAVVCTVVKYTPKQSRIDYEYIDASKTRSVICTSSYGEIKEYFVVHDPALDESFCKVMTE